MAKSALISKHIVLSDHPSKHRYPQSGIILIQDGLIFDVIITTNLTELFEKYSDWNPVDYSEFYISPGVIDLNTRKEWEDLSNLTKESLCGGVTLLVLEPGIYETTEISGELYCDVVKIEVIHENTDFEGIGQRADVMKAYLFPPAPHVQSLSHLNFVLKKAQKANLPMFIDCCLPDPRLLYVASPLRLEPIEERRESLLNKNISMFVTSIPHAVKNSSSEDESISEGSPPIRQSSLKTESISLDTNRHFSICHETIPEMKKLVIWDSPNKFERNSGKRKVTTGSIYDDLDNRVNNTQQNLDDLFNIEASTYTYSGSTSYEEIKRSHTLSPNVSCETSSPLVATGTFVSKLSLRSGRLNLAPLNIKSAKQPDVKQDYSHHLANYPTHWETTGVENVLENISPSSQIHFVGISSASAFNLIRKSRTKFTKLTCEASAVTLCFTSACIKLGDTKFKNNPPVRNSANCNLLWDLLKMKGIDTICSGHAFIRPDRKITNNFQVALNGIACAGCTLQSIWYILNKPVSSHDQLEHYIVRLAKWLSLHPAKILGISDRRGSIANGKIADLIVWSPHEKYRLGQNYTYFETSPFANHEMLGKIHEVYIRGRATSTENNIKALGQIASLRSQFS